MNSLPKVFTQMAWERAALAINTLLFGYPYRSYASAPDDVRESYTYYDTTLKTVRTWDGSNWQDHF